MFGVALKHYYQVHYITTVVIVVDDYDDVAVVSAVHVFNVDVSIAVIASVVVACDDNFNVEIQCF